VKLVVHGGSGQSTPALVAYLARRRGLAPVDLVLTGRTPSRLAAVTRASRLLASGAAIDIAACGAGPEALRAALDDADVILVQARFGGLAGRRFDETFPIKYGLCGDEGLGPGGLSAAWRAWPPLAEFLDVVSETCPEALVLLLTSPVGLLTSAAGRVYPQLSVFGICEVPWVALQEVAAAINVPVDSLAFDYLGVNHAGWLYGLTRRGRPVMSAVARLRDAAHDSRWGEVVRQFDAVPTKYWRLQFDRAAVLENQLGQTESRADTLERLSEESFTAFLRGDVAEVRAVVRRRPTPWYSDAVGPFLAANAGADVSIPFFLSRPDEGRHPGFCPTDVLESAHVMTGGSLLRCPVRSQPGADVLNTVESHVRYEALASAAVVDRNPEALGAALRIHPWLADAAVVPHLVREITSNIIAPPTPETAA